MRHRCFAKVFLVSLPALVALTGLLSLLLIRYGDPAASDIRHHGLGYNTLAHHRFAESGSSADIVMIGDSTLLMGVMPRVLEERLGKSVVNLGLYATSGLKSYTLLLDDYLKRNKRPEYVIFYYAASTPYYFGDHTYEKSYTLLKYGPLPGVLLHPGDVNVIDCIRTAWTLVEGIVGNAGRLEKAREQFRKDLAIMDANKGYVANRMGDPMLEGVEFSTKVGDELDLSFIDMLRKRYEALGIKVLYCLAPMPESDSAFDFFRARYRSVDNGITRLPNRYFTDSRHVTEEGALLNSRMFAEFLKARLASDPPRPPGVGVPYPPRPPEKGRPLPPRPLGEGRGEGRVQQTTDGRSLTRPPATLPQRWRV